MSILNKFPRFFFSKSFSFWQKLGFHVIPNHYYEPIPDTSKLKNDVWLKQSELIGINKNAQSQLDLLNMFSSYFKQEYEKFPRSKTSLQHQYYVNNRAFESVDGEVLYCMIRHFKPRRIFEIGSGNSTYLSAQAALKNKKDHHVDCDLVAFEPYPNNTLKIGFPGLTKLVVTKVQDIPLSTFAQLKEDDILFIDSSHVLKIGGDVQYEYLEILPRLSKGVIVHIHDIFIPSEYPKNLVLNNHKFWTEQYLLQAFLAFNNSFEVLWAGSYMHLNHSDKLETAFNSYKSEERWPGSFWIRKTN